MDDDNAGLALFLAMKPDLRNQLDYRPTVLEIRVIPRDWTNYCSLVNLDDFVVLGLHQRVSVEVAYIVYIPEIDDSYKAD